MRTKIFSAAILAAATLFAFEVTAHPATWSKLAQRAKNGRIARSSSARRQFLESIGIKNGHTPKGYIIDHIIPLAAGGPDTPSNMRLITVAQENAQHKAEMASAKNPRGYNPNAQVGKYGKVVLGH